MTQLTFLLQGLELKKLNAWMAEFYKETSVMLLAALCKLLNTAEAEEVMQEAYLEVYLSLKAKKQIEPRPFLFRVARNIAISRLRHRQVVTKSANDVSGIYVGTQRDPSAQQINNEDKALLLAAVNTLPYACRQVFVMRKLQGKSHAEIAQIMHISVKTVENHLATGMKLCRQFIIDSAEQSTTNKLTGTR
ncbi:RNA polymerase sigma factor [Alteromonadaceae bacterium BrNp21-10]|nr:RNA polymerase sigma factor [Alteromonadaceae bacterium BrNp21-10]